jgi:hypothetical protein
MSELSYHNFNTHSQQVTSDLYQPTMAFKGVALKDGKLSIVQNNNHSFLINDPLDQEELEEVQK